MAFELEKIAILNIKGVDYKCVIWNMNESDAINRVNNYKLVIKDSLLIIAQKYGIWGKRSTP